MFKSIKIRLFVWLISFSAVMMAALGWFVYKRIDSSVREMVDHLLEDKAEILRGLIHVDKGEVEFEISETTSGDYAIKNSGHYFEILETDGTVLVASDSLGGFSFSSIKASGYSYTDGPAGEPLRLYREEMPIGDGERIIICVAEGITAEMDLLRSFRLFLLLGLPISVILIGIGSLFIVSLSFRRLAAFSGKIGMITEKRLHERIDDKEVETELRQLTTSFNSMMERLEQAFRAQRDFLADASHELRTPTSVIASSAQLALRKERSPEEYREALGSIRSATDKMRILIDKLLRLSRLDAEQISVKMEMVEIRGCVETAVKAIHPLSEEKTVTVNIGGDARPVVTGSREQLMELFLSIIENSVKYNRTGGRVDVVITESEGEAVVAVSDTGIGIPEESLGRVFDRFYRVDESRSEVPGTGLGLPIAMSIAEAHGGRIVVRSEPGKGSVFTIRLPRKVSSIK